ncbi:hypothetical protein [Streptomyces zhihengii]|uniref:hypothetical protein n=1 Tax=Streptomyces zhihengii TaxID=1818004 RepID=UPI0033B80E67
MKLFNQAYWEIRDHGVGNEVPWRARRDNDPKPPLGTEGRPGGGALTCRAHPA